MANRKQRKNRNKRVRQEQTALRRPLEGRTEREVIANGKQNQLYEDVGEDGLPMTRPRNRLKRVLSIFTIWGMICIPIAASWFIASCYPAQAYGLFLFLGYENGVPNGLNPQVLLRIEAIVSLLGLLALLVNSFTFSWMFGQASARWFGILTGVMAVVFGGYFIWFGLSVGIPDPVSLIDLVFLVLIWVSAFQVQRERPFLG